MAFELYHSFFENCLISNKENIWSLVTSQMAVMHVWMVSESPFTHVLCSGRLIALQKKLGGMRPEAVEYIWHRLAAKCVNIYALSLLDGSLAPVQLGLGISECCEAIADATRWFLVAFPTTLS